MSQLRLIGRSLAALSSLALAACDAQTGDGYQGEPLASLHGAVENRLTETPPDANVVLLWPDPSGSGHPFVAETIAIDVMLPATFTLDLFTPPELLEALPFTMGVVTAATPDADFDLLFAETPDGEIHLEGTGVLGFDAQHMIVYAPEDIREGEFAAAFLHGSPTAGFHVFDMKCLSDAEKAEVDACIEALGPQPDSLRIWTECGGTSELPWFVPAPADLETELTVELVDDVTELEDKYCP